MKKDTINSLTDLRALSAIFVVLAHISCTGYLFTNHRGQYAVSCFYILSSFLSMYTTDKQLSIKENILFIFKKILKLLPLYYIFTYIIAYIKPSFFYTVKATPVNLIKSLLFVPYINDNGIVRPILDVTWFLVLIFWYYILFGICRIINQKNRGIILSLVLFGFYYLGQMFFSDNPIFIQYKTGVFDLILGVLIYYIYNKIYCKTVDKPNIKSTSIINNVIIYAIFFVGVYIYSYIYKLNLFLAEVIPFIIVLLFVIFGKSKKIKIISLLSEISYSLYLVHEFVVKGFSRLIYNLDELTIVTFLLSFFCLIISIITALVVNRVLEKPINKLIFNINKKTSYKKSIPKMKKIRKNSEDF